MMKTWSILVLAEATAVTMADSDGVSTESVELGAEESDEVAVEPVSDMEEPEDGSVALAEPSVEGADDVVEESVEEEAPGSLDGERRPMVTASPPRKEPTAEKML